MDEITSQGIEPTAEEAHADAFLHGDAIPTRAPIVGSYLIRLHLRGGEGDAPTIAQVQGAIKGVFEDTYEATVVAERLDR